MTSWFDVDKEGLAKLLEKKGKKFAIAELISNAWDQNVKRVEVRLTKQPGKPYADLLVEDDDPNGFTDLSHAFTLFAESAKKGEATKRGRFNLGEKLVLAVCENAMIASTKGTVVFDNNGRRTTRSKRSVGSEFSGTIRMNQQEYEEACEFVRTLIVPPDICTMFNGEVLQPRPVLAEFEAPLQTVIADEQGFLTKSVRKATVRVYEPLPDETPSLYEMGIPVVETGDKWHIDVLQKVPLNMDRDNVPPRYLQHLRALALNNTFQKVTGDDVSATWVKSATEHPEAKPEVVEHVITQMFGEKRVIYDPTDVEANKRAIAEGYSVIHGRSLSAGQWDHVRENKLALPAGQVTPSNKVLSSPDGEDKTLKLEKHTAGMKQVEAYSIELAKRLGINISVRFVSDITQNFVACYGSRLLTFNVGRLGYRWFDDGVTPSVNSIIIHELGHEFSGDHLSEDFHNALCDIGAKMTRLAMLDPGFFKSYATPPAKVSHETLAFEGRA